MSSEDILHLYKSNLCFNNQGNSKDISGYLETGTAAEYKRKSTANCAKCASCASFAVMLRFSSRTNEHSQINHK